MKKIFLTALLGLSLLNTPVSAAPKVECSFSPLQQVIRSARKAEEIEKLINDNVNLNAKFRCGGNVLQLATLRGNAEIFQLLIQKGNLPLNTEVSNTDYPIPGAPKSYPLAFFIAYHAPSQDIMNIFMQSGAKMLDTDDRGETILWYLDQNPVLMNTDVYDALMQQLLMKDTVDGAMQPTVPQVAESDKKQDTKAKGKPKEKGKEKSDGGAGLVESEPDQAFNPNTESLEF